MALHLDAGLVQMDRAVNEESEVNKNQSKYQWSDLWSHGPVNVRWWHGEQTESGVVGDAKLATAAKGKMLFEEAVKNLIGFADLFHGQPERVRRDHHEASPLTELPG